MFVALAKHPHKPGLKLDIAQFEFKQLRNAQPGSIEQLNDGAISRSRYRVLIGRLDNALNLLRHQIGRMVAGDFRRRKGCHRVGTNMIILDQVTVELFQR